MGWAFHCGAPHICIHLARVPQRLPVFYSPFQVIIKYQITALLHTLTVPCFMRNWEDTLNSCWTWDFCWHPPTMHGWLPFFLIGEGKYLLLSLTTQNLLVRSIVWSISDTVSLPLRDFDNPVRVFPNCPLSQVYAKSGTIMFSAPVWNILPPTTVSGLTRGLSLPTIFNLHFSFFFWPFCPTYPYICSLLSFLSFCKDLNRTWRSHWRHY